MTSTDDRLKEEKCRLHEVQGLEAWCTRESCIYWRMLEPQDIDLDNEKGCGLQHFGVLGGLTPEVAAWLLSMKKRLENTSPESAKARITFRRREE
ncbi:MAG: hypothetical protein ACYCXF_09205 [Thermoleophilia bacterium]